MMTIKELLKKAVAVLKDGSSESPILDAELLLIHVMNKRGLNMNKIKLITESDKVINEETAEDYMDAVHARRQGMPVQYMTHSQEFMGLDFYITEGVLIPRPDTEILVEKVINLVKGKGPLRIIDMCAGSGAIAVSLAYYIPDAAAYGADVSDQALTCCKINIERHGLTGRVIPVKSNLFDHLSNLNLEGNIDVIASNPPYIPSRDIPHLPESVKDYEPNLALDGGTDGLWFYHQIVRTSASYLKSGGILAFEIGYNQGQEVKNILEESQSYHSIHIEKDLAGLDRCVWAVKV